MAMVGFAKWFPSVSTVRRIGVRVVRNHARWVRRGLRTRHAWIVALYLCFVGLLCGFVAGYQSAEGIERRQVGAAHTPKPVTPPPPGTVWVEVKTTGYCPCGKCCGKDADGQTAIGRQVDRYPHGIATEPRIIPYRTWLNIPGYGEFMVDDTGGAMRQSAKRHVVHLDLRFKTHMQARKWGVRWMWVAMPDHIPAAAMDVAQR